ncbi:hypothetical protein SNE40_011756 [Patella caerulea]|uniref:G-protein coupled receptors family 1 profile domain-containing protein n=1 Tax=Patella caerulea TaxID=87958 RepID=A0AAN8JND6_PATCE
MTAAQRVYKLWIYGDVLCRATPYLQGIAVSASTFTITAMSLDRCLAIRHPVSFRRLRTTKTVRILILFVWLISLIIMVPILLVRRTVTDEILPGAKFTYCIEVWTSQIHRQAYDIFILFIVYMCPGILIATCYTLMGQRLWVPDKQLNNKTMLKDGGNKHITSGRRRLAKMCIGVAVMFAVCWLPYYIVNTYLNFKSDIVAANIVHFMLLVGHFHSATNPVLYCFLHKTFRRYLKRFLASCFKIKLGEHSRLLSKGIFSQPNATTKSFKCSYKSSVRNSRIPATSPKYPQSATLCPPTGNIHSDNSSDVRFQHSFISGTNDPSDTDNSSSVAAEVMTLSTVPSKKEVRHVSLSINGKLYETSDRLSDDSS